MNKKYKILALIGKAGSGKDTLLRAVCDSVLPIHEIVSFTTRPPREGEVNGENYIFVSGEEFAQAMLDGQMIEACEFNNWFYGTGYESLRTNIINIGVFNPAGVQALAHDPEVELKVVYVRAADKERLLRQLNREEDPDCHEIVRRFRTDEEDFMDIDYPHIEIYNDTLADLAVSTERLLDLIDSWQNEGKTN